MLFTKEIYAEGTPFIGIAVCHAVKENPSAFGLIQGINGEWYDPNETVEEERQELEVSEMELLSSIKPREGFTSPILDQLDLLLQDETPQQVFKKSINFVKETVPPELWTKSVDQLMNSNSSINNYLNNMVPNFSSRDELASFIHFKAAVRAYDICHLTGHDQDMDKLKEHFEGNLNKLKEYITTKFKSDNKEAKSEPVVQEINKKFNFELLETLSEKIKYCKTQHEVYNICMNFVAEKVPEYIWSKTEQEIRDQNSRVYLYLEEFNRNVIKGDETITFVHFQAAVAAYNTGQLLNVLDKEELLFTAFKQALIK